MRLLCRVFRAAVGNLGRAGYGGTLGQYPVAPFATFNVGLTVSILLSSTEGMWPYTYDSCDVGTLANQTQNGALASAFAWLFRSV